MFLNEKQNNRWFKNILCDDVFKREQNKRGLKGEYDDVLIEKQNKLWFKKESMMMFLNEK